MRLNGTQTAPRDGGSPASQPACRGSAVDFVACTGFKGRQYAGLDVAFLSSYALGYRIGTAAERTTFQVALTMEEEAVWTAVVGRYGATGSYLA